MRHPTWTVEVKMKLGKETSKFSGKVSLGDDVRTVLRNMAETRSLAVGAINDAYESIIVSSSSEMSKRLPKKSRK